MRFWFTYVLKWELSREREIDLKSFIEKKNLMLLMKFIYIQVFIKLKLNLREILLIILYYFYYIR